jgi:hypothetical protein
MHCGTDSCGVDSCALVGDSGALRGDSCALEGDSGALRGDSCALEGARDRRLKTTLRWLADLILCTAHGTAFV